MIMTITNSYIMSQYSEWIKISYKLNNKQLFNKYLIFTGKSGQSAADK